MTSPDEDPAVLRERSRQERLSIVARYDAGPVKDHTDEWENPTFEIYHKQDRYGFIQ